MNDSKATATDTVQPSKRSLALRFVQAVDRETEGKRVADEASKEMVLMLPELGFAGNRSDEIRIFALGVKAGMTEDGGRNPFTAFIDALRADREMQWGYHCNIAVSAHEEGLSHKAANNAAERFMRLLLGSYEPLHVTLDDTKGTRSFVNSRGFGVEYAWRDPYFVVHDRTMAPAKFEPGEFLKMYAGNVIDQVALIPAMAELMTNGGPRGPVNEHAKPTGVLPQLSRRACKAIVEAWNRAACVSPDDDSPDCVAFNEALRYELGIA